MLGYLESPLEFGAVVCLVSRPKPEYRLDSQYVLLGAIPVPTRQVLGVGVEGHSLVYRLALYGAELIDR